MRKIAVRDQFGRIVVNEKEVERPIFIFGAGERCGTTLLQRYLMTFPDVHIWGEQHGALNSLATFWKAASLQAKKYAYVVDAYASNGTAEFIANLCPPSEIVQSSLRSMILHMLAGFAPRWGCKEVRCGRPVVVMLQSLFPCARFVFVVRDIAPCLSSLQRWNVSAQFYKQFVARWRRLAGEFKQCEAELMGKGMSVRYEDLVENAEEKVRICGFLEVDDEQGSSAPFLLRVADHANIENIPSAAPRQLQALSQELQAVCESEAIVVMRRQYGYV
jgi:hypothetical protein